jgi:heme/copper-type cytochrome/quinol oxidase subunit 1
MKPVFKEIAWLAACIGASILLVQFVFNWNFRNELDIHFHDTYLVIPAIIPILTMLLILIYLVYLVKELRQGFSRKFPNIVLLCSGICMIVMLNQLSYLVTQTMGFTWYPPLSSLGSSEIKENPVIKMVIDILLVMQLLVILSLLYVTFRWGKRSDTPRMKA